MSSNAIVLGNYEYNPADILGSGAFAIVYKGRSRDKKGQKVAIKQMIKGQNFVKSQTLLCKEISVLRKLQHKHIVRVFDSCVSNTDVYLVMEFCNGGDLSEYLHNKKNLPEETVRHFLIQIGSAMDSMNKKAIMHRDLKPGNILLSYDECYASVNEAPGTSITFKLADFGFARFLQDKGMAETMCGSPMYMAPEVLMGQKYDASADIWSMGVIIYQCFFGKAPFFANSPEALKNIYLKTVDLKPKIPPNTSRELRDLLLKMLIRKPADRINFPSFFSHPFLNVNQFSSPSDCVSHQPASVPPLPRSLRRPAGPQSAGSQQVNPTTRRFASHRPPLHHKTDPANASRGRSTIAELMPTTALSGVRCTRLVAPTAGPRRYPTVTGTHGNAPPLPPPRVPHPYPSTDDNDVDKGLSDASLTPTEDGDEFIEDGLGGSSFLFNIDRNKRQVPLATDRLTADPYPRNADASLQSRPRNQLERRSAALDKSLDGYIIVHSAGLETEQNNGFLPPITNQTSKPIEQALADLQAQRLQLAEDDRSLIPTKSRSGGQFRDRHQPASPPTNTNHLNSLANAHKKWSPAPSQSVAADAFPTDNRDVSKSADADCPAQHVSAAGNNHGHNDRHDLFDQRYISRLDTSGLHTPHELVEEELMEKPHSQEMQTMTMVLELCELLLELAERRASALSDCTTTTIPTSATAAQAQRQLGDFNDENCENSSANSSNPPKPLIKLKLIPEAKRIVEQLVLYRRILYYLEYVFGQAKKAAEDSRLKPTSIAKKRLTDCNVLYHRCYNRLCLLSHLACREDLLKPIGRHLSRVTANRLIFNYALDQCYAAEMDDYIGELDVALRRYRAAITLIHGLCQHAESGADKSLLADCLRMIQDRHATLWTHLAGGPDSTHGDANMERRMADCSINNSALLSSAVEATTH